MVIQLNCSKIMNDNSNKVAKNRIASFTLRSPRARGRFCVRSTFLSNSRSHMSLIIQPAPRIRMLPIRKSVHSNAGTFPGDASVKPQSPGKNRSQIPIGRSMRMRYA